jgi:hypothetical protein
MLWRGGSALTDGGDHWNFISSESTSGAGQQAKPKDSGVLGRRFE